MYSMSYGNESYFNPFNSDFVFIGLKSVPGQYGTKTEVFLQYILYKKEFHMLQLSMITLNQI